MTDSDQFDLHMKRHIDQRVFQCLEPGCNYTCTTEEELVNSHSQQCNSFDICDSLQQQICDDISHDGSSCSNSYASEDSESDDEVIDYD